QFLRRVVVAADIDLDPRRILVHERKRRVAVGLQFGEALPVHHRDFNRDYAERVSVGRRGCDRRMTHHTGAAGAVDDIEGLFELFLEHRRNNASRRVRAPAGAPWANDGDRAAWPSLSARWLQS